MLLLLRPMVMRSLRRWYTGGKDQRSTGSLFYQRDQYFDVVRRGEAEKVVKMQEESYHRRWTTASGLLVQNMYLIDAAGEMGRIDTARAVLALLEERSAAEIRPDVRVFRAFVGALCLQSRLMTEAEQFVVSMERGDAGRPFPGIVVYNTLVNGFARHRMDGKMEEWVASMEGAVLGRPKPNVVTLTTVVTRYAESGRLDKARALLRSMERGEFGRPPPAVQTYTVVMEQLGRAGRVEEAVALLHAMERGSMPPNVVTYNSVVNALSKTGEIGEMERLFGKMCNKVDNTPPPNEATFTSVFNAYARVGLVAKAQGVLSQMQAMRTGRKPDEHMQAAVMDMYANHMMEKEGVALFQAMKDQAVTPHFVGSAMKLIARMGDLDKLRECIALVVSQRLAIDVRLLELSILCLGHYMRRTDATGTSDADARFLAGAKTVVSLITSVPRWDYVPRETRLAVRDALLSIVAQRMQTPKVPSDATTLHVLDMKVMDVNPHAVLEYLRRKNNGGGGSGGGDGGVTVCCLTVLWEMRKNVKKEILDGIVNGSAAVFANEFRNDTYVGERMEISPGVYERADERNERAVRRVLLFLRECYPKNKIVLLTPIDRRHTKTLPAGIDFEYLPEAAPATLTTAPQTPLSPASEADV